MRSLAAKLAGLPLALWAWLLARPALAGVTEQTAEQVANKLVDDVIKPIVIPIAGLVIAAMVLYIGIGLIVTAHDQEKRARLMAALPTLAIGAVLAGAAVLVAGFLVWLMKKAGA